MEKSYMFLYPTGARGDFLISILIGDVLAASYNKPWIIHHMAFKKYIKTHDTKIWWPSTEKFDSNFSNYSIIRIKVENAKDADDIATLACYKMPHVSPISAEFILKWEEHFSIFPLVDYLVPFGSLFDIDYLENLFFKFRQRVLSEEERQRILHNIQLNIDIIKGAQHETR